MLDTVITQDSSSLENEIFLLVRVASQSDGINLLPVASPTGSSKKKLPYVRDDKI
jgi:hypothetical protein